MSRTLEANRTESLRSTTARTREQQSKSKDTIQDLLACNRELQEEMMNVKSKLAQQTAANDYLRKVNNITDRMRTHC